jgi:prephenate dehydrogenase
MGMKTVEQIGEALNFKNISTLTVEEHDEMIGFLSQLTHCIAVSLMTCKESSDLVEYTGDSFRDLTRIAKINENMWSELFLLNKEELLKQMDLFLEQFNKLKQTIEEENVEKMKEIMRLSTLNRSYFDK